MNPFAGLLPEEQLLAWLALATGLLLVIAILFAALTIWLRLRSMRRHAVRSQLERRWEPILLAALAGDADPAAVRREVPRRYELFFVEYLLRFVRRFVGVERHVLRELARPYLPRVAAQLRSRRPEARARAAQTLVLLDLEQFDREVVAALDDESLTVAMVAARALASPEHTRFAAEILRRVHRFEHWNPLYLASLFSGMGSDVVPALRAIYADASARPLVRRVAADALHDLDDIGSADTAHAVAVGEQDPELVASSLRLLGRVGRPPHAAVLRHALAHPNPLLRLRAAEALGSLGGEEDLLRLNAALDDPSPWVALAAARGLARAGGREMLASIRADELPRGALAREVLSTTGRPA